MRLKELPVSAGEEDTSDEEDDDEEEEEEDGPGLSADSNEGEKRKLKEDAKGEKVKKS